MNGRRSKSVPVSYVSGHRSFFERRQDVASFVFSTVHSAMPHGAGSTSPGIGIEIWLPAKANWNNRVHAVGGGGWMGGAAGSATAIASLPGLWDPAGIAGGEGAVSSLTDTGHTIGFDGSFAMNPDGT